MVKVYLIVLIIVSALGIQVYGYRNSNVHRARDYPDAWRSLADGRGADLGCTHAGVYSCEVPPNATAPSDEKRCNYRNVDYHQQVYRWVAGRGCLFYTPEFLFVGGQNSLNLNAACAYGNLVAPCMEIAKEDGTCGCFPFDPAFPEVAAAVAAATVAGAAGRWERCYRAAADCCAAAGDDDEHADEELEFIEPEVKCPTTFDGWTCWESTGANTQAFEVCSEFAYSNVGPSCNHYSSKTCHLDGSWEIQTDYSSCSVTPRLVARYRFYIAVLAFSVASCGLAIFVFLFYRRLRIPRVALHRNLIVAIVCRNVVVIVTRSEIYLQELTVPGDTTMSSHGAACRALAVAERVAANAVFVCMLVEGIYLHRLIVAVFRKKLDLRMLYGVGAVIAIVPVVVWAVLMAHYDDHSCWLVYTVPNVQWILDAPRIAILVVNTVLLLDILRILLTKVRNKENANQLNTTKATLFLMPLFGVQFLLTAFRPTTSNCAAEQTYYYVTFAVEGLQGFVVALLFCYVNREVQSLVKATYKKTENAVMSRVWPELPAEHSTSRRITHSTNLESYPSDKLSNLHVAKMVKLQSPERIAECIEPVYDVVTIGMVNGCFRIDTKEQINDTTSRKCDNGAATVSNVYVDHPAENVDRYITNNLKHAPPFRTLQYGDNDFAERLPDRSYIYAAATTTFKPVNDDTNERVDSCNNQLNNNEESNSRSDDSFDPTDDNYGTVTEEMLNDLIQKLTTNDNVKFDAKVLCPNRSDGDNIVFE